MNRPSSIPLATYRLQLNHEFTFADATAIVPYLSALGISHCYLSPCLKARPGSMHGYDIVDHNSFNPEIGTAEDFDTLVSALHQHGMGIILDIVPNHMGVMGSDNAWWLDVLENGESSVYANYFDIDWHPQKDELDGKVLIPVLHDHYGAVLESGDLKLAFHSERGEFDVNYHNHRFPINPRQYPRIMDRCVAPLTQSLGEQNQDLLELQSLIASFSHLPARDQTDAALIAERNRDKEIHKRRLAELCARSQPIADCIAKSVESMNGTVGDSASFEALHELIKAQAFRLANWRVAADDINYRRFFDTNDLAGICVENPAVFEATHRKVLNLASEGKVNGLRIDHPDGLYDPARYLQRLHQEIESATSRGESDPQHYVVIEKILTGAEKLRPWPISGTTGYDFANLANGLFVDSGSIRKLDRVYRNFIDDEIDLAQLMYRCRKLIIRVSLASEVNVLANQLTRIALSRRRTCDFTTNSLRDALTEIAASFPVYRTYVSQEEVSEEDALYIRIAIALAKRRSPAADTSIFDFIADVLLTRIGEGQNPSYRNAVNTFAMKFQQFTSPVMAKGVEDTAFYRFNRLVSLNEVGSDLRHFGTTPREFHAANLARLREWPHSMLASSTHDSKRSEDVRARINVLSEIPDVWGLRVRDWKRFNRGHKVTVNDRQAPCPNDEYLLYQTLIGAWPLRPLESEQDWNAFRTRIENYMLKAIREGKQNTSWINQNADYENAMSAFIQEILSPAAENRFLRDFLPFQQRVVRIGLYNSLSQTLLKLTAPGVPDIYQGNELWDFSLVDPDNRRPVDYETRLQLFDSMRNWGNVPPDDLLRKLAEDPRDGRLKMYVISKILCLRRQQPDLFYGGEYHPLSVEGPKAQHVIAFARRLSNVTIVVAVPRLIAGLLGDLNVPPTGENVWQDTRIVVPQLDHGKNLRNVLTGEILPIDQNHEAFGLRASALFSRFPVAVCTME